MQTVQNNCDVREYNCSIAAVTLRRETVRHHCRKNDIRSYLPEETHNMNYFHFTSHIKVDEMVLLYSSGSEIYRGKLKDLLCWLAEGYMAILGHNEELEQNHCYVLSCSIQSIY